MKELNALIDRHKNKEEWLNYRTALICSLIANTARDPKRKRTPYTPQDFMPGTQHSPQTAKQMLATVKVLNAAYGGTVKEK